MTQKTDEFVGALYGIWFCIEYSSSKVVNWGRESIKEPPQPLYTPLHPPSKRKSEPFTLDSSLLLIIAVFPQLFIFI